MTDGREIIVARRRLGEHCRDLLVAQGLSTGDALTVADSLVSAECRGTVSHGVARLPHYLERLRRGSIQARPAITVAREFGATMLLEGGDGLGQVVNQRAVTEVTRLTRDHGCGWVSIRRNSHCGAMAYYGLQIAREEMVAIVFTHSDSLVLPHGARHRGAGPGRAGSDPCRRQAVAGGGHPAYGQGGLRFLGPPYQRHQAGREDAVLRPSHGRETVGPDCLS